MTYENYKSAILTVLVALNVVLIWQLWTFQPELGLLKDTEYVESTTLGEERKLEQIIKPEQLVFHVADGAKLLGYNETLLAELYQQLLESEIHAETIMRTFHTSGSLEEAIEIIFPAAIPVDIFHAMLEVEEEYTWPLTKIDRIFVYADKGTEEIKFRFVSDVERILFDATSTFSFSDFLNIYLAEAENAAAAIAVSVGAEDGEWPIKLYIPEEAIAVDSISYTTSTVPINVFQQRLFSDPVSVKVFRQENGEESYTDGNRMINISGNGNYMDYINPVYSEGQERSVKHIITSSHEFINGHGGWTDHYVLSEWNTTSLEDRVTYRLRLNTVPVLEMEGMDSVSLYVEKIGNQISRYSRPLFDLDYQPIDARRPVQLASGEELLETISQEEFFDYSRLKKITVGYELRKRNAIVSLEPHWYMLYDGRWQKIYVEDNQLKGDDYGLE